MFQDAQVQGGLVGCEPGVYQSPEKGQGNDEREDCVHPTALGQAMSCMMVQQ